ncbi:MAG: tRNA (N(6)-L-threonylcarbamoyladenosine(37)-C(2))-methylthiotransferase [Candidatus Methanomethylicia archaeon]
MKVYIESYGCAMNNADTNLIKRILSEKHEIISDPWMADVIIINTCTVRGETEKNMMHRIKELENIRCIKGSKLIVAGCMAKVQPAKILSISPEASLISPQKIGEIMEIIESKNREIRIVGEGIKDLKKMVTDGLTLTIPIAEGCLGDCSYCIVRLARGRLKSYPENEIVEIVEKAVGKGVKEIRITAQDTAAYGFDKGTNLVNLLKKILRVQGEYRVRIGMMTPNNALKIIDGLLEVYDDDRVYKFIHIPLQSGDNNILKVMNRKYTVEDYREIVDRFRSIYPNGFITTDIISGFPGESDEAHRNTIKVLEETKPDKVNAAKYTPRPHTKAAALPQIPEKIRSERCREVIELSRKISLERNKIYEGKMVDAIVLGCNKRGFLKARMKDYRLALIEGSNELIGRIVNIKILEARETYLIGELTSSWSW